MDDTKKTLLSIDLDVAALTQNAANAKAVIKDLSDQLTALKASGKDSGDAFDKLSEQLKKATEAADKSSGTLKDYSKSLTDSGKAAGDLSEQHSKLETSATKTSRSIADYTNNVLHAAEAHTPFGKTIGEMVQSFNAVKDGTGKVIDGFSKYRKEVSDTLDKSTAYNSSAGIFAKGFEVLKANMEVATGGIGNFTKALAGTGIGLIIVAVAALIEYLQKFKPIADLVEQAMAGFNGALAAGKHILDDFFGSITSVGDLFSKLGNIMAHPIDSLINLGKAMGEAAIKTAQLKKAQQELDELVQGSSVKAAETEARIAELKVKMLTATLAQRKAIQQQITQLQNKETTDHQHNAEEQVRITVAKVAATSGLTMQQIGDIHKLDEAKIESLAKSKHLDDEAVKSLRDAVKQMNNLRKEEADGILKKYAEHQTALQTHVNKLHTIYMGAHAVEKKEGQQRSAQIEQTDAGTIDNIAKREAAAALKSRKAQQVTFAASIKSQKELDEEKALSSRKAADAENKLSDIKLDKQKGYFAQLQSLFGKHTIASKAAFLAQKAIAFAEVVINTQRQVSAIALGTAKMVANDASYGLAAPIFIAKDTATGIVQTVEAIVSGAIQAATIVGTAISGFAKGGIYKSDGYGAYLNGPGNGTSDSINARLSNGESIINARSTQMFAPILSSINQAGGGRAFSTANGGNGYALGGIFSGSNTLNDSSSDLANTRAINDMMRTMAANMPRQVLVVEDVQASLQNKIMLQNMSNF